MRRTQVLALGISVLLVPATASSAPMPTPQGAPSVTAPIAQASNPIPGVGIVVKRNPGTATANGVTGSDGRFSFSGLQPGSYSLTVAGQPPVTVVVGADGQMAGVATNKGVQLYAAKAGKSGSPK